MTKPSRSSVIGVRVQPEARARFAALAARHELSEAGLLAAMINEVVKTNDPVTCGSATRSLTPVSIAPDPLEDRVTLRLREGDRRLAAERATARRMKTGTYLAMLIHNHVRGPAVLPPKELDQIRVTCAQLAALGRLLRMFGMSNSSAAATSELIEVITLVRKEVEMACEVTAAVVRWNLVSWETGSEMGHA
jgi:hypothetical protein